MTYLVKATSLYEMIGQGQIMEAFEEFYAENVVMIESSGDVREGKGKNREFQKQFMASIKEVHGAGVYAIASNEKTGVTIVESWMDATFNDGNRMKMEEVAVQQWKGDKIVRERFYYNMPGQ